MLKKIQSLAFYPVTMLAPDVQELMQRSLASLTGIQVLKASNVIKLFDAYCHLTATPVTHLSLSKPSFKRCIQGFLGATDDESFITWSDEIKRTNKRVFVRMLEEMRLAVPLMPALSKADWKPGLYCHIWKAMKDDIDPIAIRYWNGWEVRGRNGKNSYYIPISHLWNSYGPEFAEQVYDLYSKDAAKKLSPSHTDFNTFVYYLSENKERWPTTAFKDPIEMKRLFVDFMLHSFQLAVHNKVDLNTRARSYSKFIHSIDEIFLQSGVWARPFSGTLPKPPGREIRGVDTNHKKKADGTIVKVKLITEVPLQLTDSQAIEIIFKTIKDDNALVLKWARYRLQKAREAYEACIELGQLGTPITGGNKAAKTIDQIGAENICATYLKEGITYLQKNTNEVLGYVSKTEVYNLLGIPTADTIFALQMLLAYSHPIITDSFLVDFELFNKKGHLSGFTKTELGLYQLTGYKDRSGGANSERKVLLSNELAEWIQLMIKMTQVLRDELKAAGDDQWRYLFLHTKGALVSPKRPVPLSLNKAVIKSQTRMIAELMKLGNRGETATKLFMAQLSITAFRASAAVEIFLRDHDAEEMAKALGHKAYRSSLLSHYLPEPILAFFQTRWIRLFQRGIICHAMKDSPRLLEVTHFADMDELHEFLKNHALREIPEHLQNPDYLKAPRSLVDKNESNGDKAGQVMVSIDTGVLTALLSLRAAVTLATNEINSPQKNNLFNEALPFGEVEDASAMDRSQGLNENSQENHGLQKNQYLHSPKSSRQICSKAIYWLKFSDLVVKEIETGLDTELQGFLKTAYQYADAAHMENLIYATSS